MVVRKVKPASSVSDEKRDSIAAKKPQWYVFRVQSKHEDAMIRTLKSSFALLKKDGIDGNEYFLDFSVPKHRIVKYVNGKRIEKDVSAYPGYIFLKLKLTDEILLFLKNFFKMNGFGQMLPKPVSDSEYEKMISSINDSSEDSGSMVFTSGQRVKVNSGSFASMEGNIKSINNEERKLVVTVMIFNCETDIDVNFDQVTIIHG